MVVRAKLQIITQNSKHYNHKSFTHLYTTGKQGALKIIKHHSKCYPAMVLYFSCSLYHYFICNLLIELPIFTITMPLAGAS